MINKKKLFLFAFCVFLLTLTMICGNSFFWSTIKTEFVDDGATIEKISAEKKVIQQYMQIDHSIRSLDVLMMNKSDKEVVVKATLYRNEGLEMIETLGESSQTLPITEGNGYSVVSFSFEMRDIEEPISGCLCLTVQEGTAISYIATNGQYDVPLFVDGEVQLARLRMTINYGKRFMLDFWILTYLTAFILLVICFWPPQTFKIENAFLVMAIVTGIAFAVINPMLQECDGLDHFVRAMDVSYGNVFGSFVNLTHNSNEIIVPVNFKELNYHLVEPYTGSGAIYAEHLKSSFFSDITETSWYQYTVTSVYYWPQGLGIWLGRIFDGSMYTCILLSRLCNLLCYTGITFAAIRIMPVYKNLLAVIATLPMTIHQAASDSPDALLNAFCFLFIALCFYYAYSSEKTLNWKHMLPLGGLLAVIFMCKYVYVCIGILAFIIPQDRFMSKKKYWVAFSVALIPMFFICGNMLLTMFGTLGKTQAEQGGLTQFQYILQHPMQPVKALIYTLAHYTRYHIQWLSCLGSMNYELDLLIPLMPCFVTAVGCLDVPKNKAITGSQRILTLIGALAVIIGVCMAMYIGDGNINPVGAEVILGIQGRYYIPIILLPFVSFGSKKIINQIDCFAQKVMAISMFMLLYSIISLVVMCY